jgi:MFS family permease
MESVEPVVTEPKAELPWGLFRLVGGTTLLTSMNFSLMFVAFGKINETFRSQPTIVSWALTGFSVTAAAFLVPAGWMADRFGRERMFVGGLALFTLGSAVVAAAPIVGLLVAGRVVQAMGLVVESSAALPILLNAFPPTQRATIVGSLGATGGAAAAIGPVIGGGLVDAIGWRATVALNVPAGLLLCRMILRRLPMPKPAGSKAPPDLVGVAALAAGMGALVLAITKVNAWGATNGLTVSVVLAALTLLATVVFRSRRHPDPILYLPLFRDRSYRTGAMLNMIVAGTFAGTFFSFIQLLTKGWGLSTFAAGACVAVIPLFGGPLSFVAGRLADRHGPRVVIVPGAIVIAAAGLIFGLAVSPHRDIARLWLPVGALYGIGVGFAHAACHGAALRTVPPARLGIGSSMSRIAMDLGGAISVATSVALVSTASDTVAGVRRISFLLSGVCLAGALLATRLRRPDAIVVSTVH